MDAEIKNVRLLIEHHRILSGFSSLPFLACPGARSVVCWFNYYIDQGADCISLTISDVYTLSNGEDISAHRLSEEIIIPIEKYDTPKLQEADYYSALAKISDNYDAEAMWELLQSAELPPLLPAYKRVLELIVHS